MNEVKPFKVCLLHLSDVYYADCDFRLDLSTNKITQTKKTNKGVKLFFANTSYMYGIF